MASTTLTIENNSNWRHCVLVSVLGVIACCDLDLLIPISNQFLRYHVHNVFGMHRLTDPLTDGHSRNWSPPARKVFGDGGVTKQQHINGSNKHDKRAQVKQSTSMIVTYMVGSRILSGTRPSVETVLGVCLQRICSLDTSTFSALEVPDDNCAL